MKTTQQEILAFIAAADRLPNTPAKEVYVRFLVKQYELNCAATVIKNTQNAPNITPILSQGNKYNYYENKENRTSKRISATPTLDKRPRSINTPKVSRVGATAQPSQLPQRDMGSNF